MTDIFKDGQEVKQEQPVGSSESNTTDELTKLSKRVQDSQEHISKIEKENAELREQMKKAKTIEDVLAEIHKPEQLKDLQADETKPEPQTNLKPQDIKVLTAELVKQQLTELEMQKLARDNGKMVAEALRKRFGDKAESEFNAKAKQIGMSEAQFNALAQSSPKAILEFFALKPELQARQATTSINTEAVIKHNQETTSHSPDRELVRDYVNSRDTKQTIDLFEKYEKRFLESQK